MQPANSWSACWMDQQINYCMTILWPTNTWILTFYGSWPTLANATQVQTPGKLFPAAARHWTVEATTKTSRRKRYRRTKMIKITASSQRGASFCIQNLSKKRSIYFGNDNPSMTSASKRATATFSHIFFNMSAVASIRFFPVHSHRHWKERMHFHIWGLQTFSQSNTRHPEPIHLTRREAHSEGSENMKEKNVNVFITQRP